MRYRDAKKLHNGDEVHGERHNMNKSFIIAITEENVDGCGGYAAELVKIDRSPTNGDIEQLKKALDEVKCSGQEDLSTKDMITEAMNRVFGSNWNYVPHTDIAF